VSHDEKTDPYSPRVLAYLDIEARMAQVPATDPEYGVLDERREDLWYTMTHSEHAQLRAIEAKRG